MIGISEYGYVLGSSNRSVEQVAASRTAQEHVHMRSIGLSQIPTDNERMLSDMIAQVYRQIKKKPERILIAHSLPFIRADHGTAMPCGEEVPTYYLSGTPCAIMHKAVEAGCGMLHSGVCHSVLIIGADKAYCDEERLFFGTIMGDGVVAVLLEDDVQTDAILASNISTTVIASDGENSAPDAIARFRRSNAALVAQCIRNCIKKAGVDHVDHYVTHTSNRTFWDLVAPLCREPRGKFLDDNICNTGHMNSHDSFYHYLYWCEQGIIKPGETAMLVNPGFGGTQGCTLIRRNGKGV